MYCKNHFIYNYTHYYYYCVISTKAQFISSAKVSNAYFRIAILTLKMLTYFRIAYANLIF